MVEILNWVNMSYIPTGVLWYWWNFLGSNWIALKPSVVSHVIEMALTLVLKGDKMFLQKNSLGLLD